MTDTPMSDARGGANPEPPVARPPAAAVRPLSSSAARVQEAMGALGFDQRVFELEVPVRTALDAAAAVGCDVGQIAKSLIFRTPSNRAVLVITSGANRVNEARISVLLGEPLLRADPDFVRERTGFAIGGIPPIGHSTPLETFVDQDLLRWPRVWAAAGHPNALFEITPQELARMAGGRVVEVA